MEHELEITRTHHEVQSVPDAFHGRCSCGWTSSAHDQDELRSLHRQHVASGVVPAPAPYSPSPD